MFRFLTSRRGTLIQRAVKAVAYIFVPRMTFDVFHPGLDGNVAADRSSRTALFRTKVVDYGDPQRRSLGYRDQGADFAK